jgi:osmoprotectant transport system substrate-binding protein
MVRKHTRRAAKAAFAISFGVALLIGLTACGGGGGGKTTTSTGSAPKPKVIVGTKNFTEEFILGQLYAQALKAKGFPVEVKSNIGSSEIVDAAITSHKINFYPEYTGVIVLDLAKKTSPKSAAANYAEAKKFEETRGLTLLKPTPFYDSDTVSVLKTTAQQHGLKTIADLKKLGSFSYAGYPECDKRITCLLGLKQVYGLTKVSFVQIGTISVETLLDQHKATAGDIFSTEPALASGKYTPLTDTKHIFGFQNVAPVVSQKLLKGSNGMLLESICNKVSSKLTIDAMIAMNKAVGVDKKTPAAVAKQFLQANGLLG